ncbi:branched-chain amino acid ABC transporter ATP-binding protein/permease [Burkholderia pseudomallei]|uniref:branched-chain amino acid ABC transporter ATP-binding protein/permease n=1 Tax=Burkholderia pseudomallei TaxID=28450 RepID=UPI0007182881|nr:branched-chain amino acid ABC transporter ATP-binding protein/permease [Burkholderia pseudomallei]MBF4028743.1 branched-chain amino acid ABC transporter ATP-binding protein/permease [Burkholderia pseudomallei]OMT32086.1 branched-chain amino acid ABC transporter permease [Burkholderia pseudomallei]OMT75249.1 branched-chain amino acid ABC transporter permease [Burkholderia pseudomallei]ONE66794.1 branched-chain amino acid ABC transporter permease [Burkholderia pseudomallei]CAJ2779267.1 ABC-tr
MSSARAVAVRSRLPEALAWLAFVALLVVPALAWPRGWMLGYLAQTAAMIVLALSYNLLLGTTGLLSFGHAAFAGLGAFVAAHGFNRYGLPLPLVPLAGGAAGAAFGALFGFVATRRAGTAFAMITLGIGELVAAAAWSVPEWFGGAGGVSIDRAAGPALAGWEFGKPMHAYALIAAWCVVAAVAMRVLVRTRLARLANAVRDNPARVAALGTDPCRVRFAMAIAAAFFAGVAGALTLIDVEVATAESVGMLRSGAVLFATVIGGTTAFFGPVVGAVLLTFFSVFVASVSRAWLLYLGLLFVAVVLAAPGGASGRWRAWRDARRHGGARFDARRALPGAGAALAGGVAIVFAAELAYALQFAQNDARRAVIGPWRFDAGAPLGWGIAALAAALGMGLAHAARRWGRGAPRTNGPAFADAIDTCGAACGSAELKARDAGDVDGSTNAASAANETNAVSIASTTSTTSMTSMTSTTSARHAARVSDNAPSPVFEVAAEPVGGGVHAASAPPALRMADVSKSFGATPVLVGIDLTIRPGERHALIGPNGAGKSTLFNLIAGALAPTRGRIALNGIELGRRRPHAVARLGLARSFQQTSVFARMSVYDNLRCAALHAPRARRRWRRGPAAAAAIDRAADAALASIGLAAHRDALAGSLSYAQQRALDVGLALASGASVFLFDEPTAGMSREQARRTIELIRRATAGKTVLMIEHDMDAVFGFADRVSVLVRGELVATGSPAAIRANAAVRAAYLGEAFER